MVNKSIIAATILTLLGSAAQGAETIQRQRPGGQATEQPGDAPRVYNEGALERPVILRAHAVVRALHEGEPRLVERPKAREVGAIEEDEDGAAQVEEVDVRKLLGNLGLLARQLVATLR